MFKNDKAKICFLPFCGGITLYTLSANKISPTLSLFPAAENPPFLYHSLLIYEYPLGVIPVIVGGSTSSVSQMRHW
jgi:hypothetical protein